MPLKGSGSRGVEKTVMFGSRIEFLRGLVRALPEPDRSAPVRAAQVARRLPVAARSAQRLIWLKHDCKLGEVEAAHEDQRPGAEVGRICDGMRESITGFAEHDRPQAGRQFELGTRQLVNAKLGRHLASD